jgi:transcriptional regulator with XRE-family HTH domain
MSEKQHPRAVTSTDEALGKRIRHLRWMLGMTQQALGALIGVKFQQVQKYEAGDNRVPASRLPAIAQALEVTVQDLFPDAPTEVETSDPEQAELARLYQSMTDDQRKNLMIMARSLKAAA